MTSSSGGARALIDEILDDGSFVEWSDAVPELAIERPYPEELAAARAKTGLRESVITGSGTISGRRVAVLVSEFGFLGGSIGVAAAEKIVAAVTRATAEHLPLLAAPVSGGTRMQEGTVAFVQMIKITAAITAHKAARLPYLVYLRNPTTGGVFASWGSLGHVTIAEPGALIGFLGPRVVETLVGQPLPAGVQTAENLYRHGLVDAVIARERIAGVLSDVLTALGAPDPTSGTGAPPTVDPLGSSAADGDAADDPWIAVERSRLTARPGLRTLLRVGSPHSVTLSGSASGDVLASGDRGLILALARFGGRGVVVIGHDRRWQSTTSAIGPGAMRVALRGIRLAEDLGLPIVTVIDTPGAALSVESEEGGLAGEIARCLAGLLTTSVATVCVILGQGGGGAALALLPCDRVVVCENGWLAPLPPEGASAIVYRDAAHAPELAAQQQIGAASLVRNGIADFLLPENPSADLAPEYFARSVADAISGALAHLNAGEPADRLAARFARYRAMGTSQGQS